MPGPKKGQGKVDSDNKVSLNDLSNVCVDVPDVMSDNTTMSDREAQCFKPPKFEPRCFDGNPADFPHFAKEIEVMMNGLRLSDEMKLMYLLKYCTGDAARAIQCCKFLPPRDGYAEAMRIMRRRFGRPSMIIRNVYEAVKGNGGQLRDDPKTVTEFLDTLMTYKNTLVSMNCLNDLNSSSVLEVVARRLPTRLQRKWVKISARIEEEDLEPGFDDILRLVTDDVNRTMSKFASILQPANQSERTVSRVKSFMTKVTQDSDCKVKCVVCGDLHSVTECGHFLQMSPMERLQTVRRKRLCFHCLKDGHTMINCKVAESGSNDSLGWHPLLIVSRNQTSSVNYNNSLTPYGSQKVYVGVLPVRVRGPQSYVDTYALLDNGSDVTLIDAQLAGQLGIKGARQSLVVNTFNSSRTLVCERVSFKLESLTTGETVPVRSAYATSSMKLGEASVPSRETIIDKPHLSGIPFSTLQDNRVRLLIGCSVPEAHKVLEERYGDVNDLFATRTPLGWTVRGPMSMSQVSSLVTSNGEKLEAMIRNMYDKEFHDNSVSEMGRSIEDSEAIKIVEETCTYKNGHFMIGLPWRLKGGQLTCNREAALKRLTSLRKRFVINADLWTKYKEVIDKHIVKGYVERLANQNEPGRWYLPHHPVFNPRKPGKLRVVFDCSAKHEGVSLNEKLYSGPDCVGSLVGLLLRFRKFPVAVAADIEEMFLQVKVPESDRDYLRFLWFDDDPCGKVSEYRMTVHPFGATSSPFCANFALRKAVSTFGSTDLLDVIDRCFYVDDCLASFDDRESAVNFASSVTKVLAKAGFRLTKWVSNSVDVLKHIVPEDRAPTMRDLSIDTLPIERTLGLQWDVKSDTFGFSVSNVDKPVTRRGVLSVLSSVFDPLGLIAPYLLPAKRLFQETCRERLQWDDALSGKHAEEWKRWVSNMRSMSLHSVSRPLKPSKDHDIVDFHVFSDASEVGLGVAVYMRTKLEDDTHVSFVMGKSRVAPLKTVSIPRLELSAALLAAQVFATVRKELSYSMHRVTFWTDSMSVIYYIRNESARFACFVANRVSKIRELTAIEQWRYVSSEENPADLASRGAVDMNAVKNKWWKGPEFLLKSDCVWPCKEGEPSVNEGNLEFKANVGLTSAPERYSGLHPLFKYYSSWHKLLKAVAWLTRYVTYLKVIYLPGYTGMHVGPLRVEDIRDAEFTIVKAVQWEAWGAIAKKDSPDFIHFKARLERLAPIISEGIARVGGRLQMLESLYETRHPALLPCYHPVTTLIIRHHHINEGHLGSSQVLSSIRRKFWIVKGGNAVRKIIDKCMVCKLRNARSMQQLMAPLPSWQVSEGNYPFEYVGVDLFGPFLVKRGRTLCKRYGCLFTCLKMRAVHIEMVHTLTTDSFILALLRFINRRGTPKMMFSDRGTNFIGCHAELKEYFEGSQTRVHEELLKRDIEWHFNPPQASHRGGLWERLIGIIKRILSSIIRNQNLSDETLETFLCEAERILNDRPLSPVREDVKDFDVLTPNKLLLLRGNPGIEDCNAEQGPTIKRWRQARYMRDIFWKRWLKEYVLTLQARDKWKGVCRNLQVGDIVLVADKSTAGRWPLGMVERVMCSSDGLVRTVEVRTISGTLVRDIRRLCLLEGVEDRELDNQPTNDSPT